MRYVKDNSCDRYDDVLDFANMVFSMEYNGIDFLSYLPKAYSKDRAEITTHHMMLEDNSDKIKALIDTYPVTLRLDDISINADYVGTVCTHPRYRGKGLFSRLLDKVEEDAIAKGTDLLILDGARERYAGFGYEKAGMKYNFDIEYKSAANETNDMYPYTFEEVDADSPFLDKMYNLYSRRNVTARDREDFYISLLSMKACAYAVIKKGRLVGYVNMSADESSINEFEIEDESKIPKLMLDIMDGFGLSKLGVTVGADEIGKIKYLEKVSAYYNVSLSHQIRILNYKKVVEFLFRWKLKYSELPDGEYVFGIKKQGEIVYFQVTIKDLKVSVSKIGTPCTNDTLIDVYEEREFVRNVTTVYCYIEKKAPAGWFPLPFFLPDADSF